MSRFFATGGSDSESESSSDEEPIIRQPAATFSVCNQFLFLYTDYHKDLLFSSVTMKRRLNELFVQLKRNATKIFTML